MIRWKETCNYRSLDNKSCTLRYHCYHHSLEREPIRRHMALWRGLVGPTGPTRPAKAIDENSAPISVPYFTMSLAVPCLTQTKPY